MRAVSGFLAAEMRLSLCFAAYSSALTAFGTNRQNQILAATWVIVKIMTPFGVPQILGAVL